ncbi:MAG: MBL fold metallo-hydrolase [PS1 clade bacterium]|uniref:MBL fold metallo-hydrolase n=1 Tax=PS1 clade bacterium TaxID=2175152 RepID=A0A937HH13_9PROT|nr:MBL fold metallo-hydrolase [PS1 clade bacterium]
MRYQIIPVTPFQQNCTVFWNEETKKGGIVDPGGDLQLLNKFIDEQGIEIEKILVTHGHLDHAGSVKAMADERGIPIIGPHKDDKFWIDGMPEAAAQYGFPEALAFEPDQWLEHGDTVDVAGSRFDVVHCPGHTPGHVVFVQSDDKVAMVGDVLFQGSIGRTDFPKGDYQQLIDSITQRLWPLGLDITFIPGHGPTSTFDAEKKTNPFVSDAALG